MRDLIRAEIVTVNSSGALQTFNTNAQTTSGGGAVPFEALLLQALGVIGVGSSPVIIVGGGDIADGVAAIGTGGTSGFGGIISIARGTVFNGATWDRLRSASVGDAAAATGLGATGLFVWNGATFDRSREVIGDGQAATGIPVGHHTLWNGATYDRSYGASSANQAAQPVKGVAVAVPPGAWTLTNNPGLGVQATATRAAGGAGVRHVLRSIFVLSIATASQPGIQWVVRDGASGVGTILWQGILGDASTSGINVATQYAQSDLNIVGSANTAMTIEFVGAPLGTTQQVVNAAGYDTQ